MKIHITSDLELKKYVQEGLKDNQGYCPCVVNSQGNPDYKCLCKDFRENKHKGETCFCGLYIKDEE